MELGQSEKSKSLFLSDFTQQSLNKEIYATSISWAYTIRHYSEARIQSWARQRSLLLRSIHLMDKKIAGMCSVQEPVGQEPSE